jgi:16S rRNA (uracil1498-N3)-methyltransferase
VQLVARVSAPAELAVPITLAQAVLKGDRMDDVVRDAVMLGVTAVQPLVTRRTETTVAALRAARVDRWRRVALASVKQSRRAVLPDICTPLTLDTYLAERRPADLSLMLVEPSAAEGIEPLAVLRRQPAPHDAAVLVGPEGGWAPEEVQAARERQVRLATFGSRTLRADAVPVAALSILTFLWESA